jgi:hypothetical protein
MNILEINVGKETFSANIASPLACAGCKYAQIGDNSVAVCNESSLLGANMSISSAWS